MVSYNSLLIGSLRVISLFVGSAAVYNLAGGNYKWGGPEAGIALASIYVSNYLEERNKSKLEKLVDNVESN